MPEISLKDTIITSLNAQEPWPENVKLFQPYEVEQILLPDNASCLAVQAFLKMCNLPFEVEMRWNAEFMSPSGRVPFIKCGAFVVSELEPIVQFAANKGVSLCSTLSTEERAEMRAYMSLITNVLVNAELYISWIDQETFNTVTRTRNSSVYPWPLGWLQTRSKRLSVIKRLRALHWHDKTLEQVLADVEQCCNSLSQLLGDRDYFFGTPTPLDALVYGHLRALLSARGPKAGLMIKPITNALLRHLMKMSSLTKMKLTLQEEYLVSQGCQLCRVRLSLVCISSRTKRSKLRMRNPSRDDICNKDVFGFKPFASKQIIIMSSNDGKMTCEYEGDGPSMLTDEEYTSIIDIINEIIHKVDEITYKLECDKVDFEIIANHNERFENLESNMNLDTIDEKTDIIVLNIGEEEIQVTDRLIDGERVVSEVKPPLKRLLETGAEGQDDETEELLKRLSNDLIKEGFNISHNIPTIDSKSNSFEVSSVADLNSILSNNLKIPSNEEMSIENLLKYFRRQNDFSNTFYPEIVDVD